GDPAMNLVIGSGRYALADDSMRIPRGLHQSGYEQHLIGLDSGDRFFQADIVLKPPRHQVVVAMPPAGLVRLLGQLQKRVPLGLVHHAVEGEQIGDVTRLDTYLAQLQPADLGRRATNPLGRVLPAYSTGFAQST